MSSNPSLHPENMADIIIADSGPVIMAAQVGLLPLLKQQFAKHHHGCALY